jgi:hypothetical protein
MRAAGAERDQLSLVLVQRHWRMSQADQRCNPASAGAREARQGAIGFMGRNGHRSSDRTPVQGDVGLVGLGHMSVAMAACLIDLVVRNDWRKIGSISAIQAEQFADRVDTFLSLGQASGRPDRRYREMSELMRVTADRERAARTACRA